PALPSLDQSLGAVVRLAESISDVPDGSGHFFLAQPEALPHCPHGARSWKRPQQDSNLRTRLRRPMLYPLSYGGCATWERVPAAGPVRTLSHKRATGMRPGTRQDKAQA